MTVEIKNALISGQKNAIPSKSYAHRIAICNFLAGNGFLSGCKDFTSQDITVTEKCLENIKNGQTVLDCGESGSTLRFMIPLCASLGGEYTFVGHGKLMERPNQELFNVLIEHGVSVEKTDVIRIKGKLSCGEYKIRGDISSQYISGLLMALPMLEGNSTITLSTPLVSSPYVDITLEVIRAYGVNVQRTESGFFINGGAKYKGNLAVQGDWSNEAFFLVLGAIAGEIAVNGLDINSVQGDKIIIDILKNAGAKVMVNGDLITVSKSSLKAFTFNAQDCPDTVPIVAVLAACANGVSVIDGVQRLRLKESDRIESVINMLSSFGITAHSDGESLTVYGGKVKAGVANSYNDHRIAMSSAVLATVADGVSHILDAQAVNKSYPTFYKDYCKVGGNAYEI